jgi:hypothetical protein
VLETPVRAAAMKLIPDRGWQQLRTGPGTKGVRHYDWAVLEITADDTPDEQDGGHSVLFIRRHRYTRTVSFYRCWPPGPVPLWRLIAVAQTRWRIEMVFTQLAKRAVRPVGGCGEHVADRDGCTPPGRRARRGIAATSGDGRGGGIGRYQEPSGCL